MSLACLSSRIFAQKAARVIGSMGSVLEVTKLDPRPPWAGQGSYYPRVASIAISYGRDNGYCVI